MRFDLGKVEKCVDQRKQVIAGGPGQHEVFALLIIQRGALEQFMQADDTGQRRA